MIDVARIIAEAVSRRATVSKPPRPRGAQEQVQRLQQIQTPVWAEQHRELGIE